MANILWDRKIDVIFGPVYNPAILYNNIVGKQTVLPFIKQGINELIIKNTPERSNAHISNLRINFNIKKTTEGSNSNKSIINIYNVSPETWKILDDDSNICQVKLYAGYGGLDYAGKNLLHHGDVTNAFLDFKNGDWVGTIETGDGEVVINTATLNKSYTSGANIKEMLKDAIKSFGNIGIEVSDAIQKSGGLKNLKKEIGSILTGKTSKLLDNLVSPFGLRWNINNNKLNLIEINKAIDDSVIELSQRTGLIGSPKKEKEGVSFRSLLITELDLDTVVYINSKNISGYFLIDEITYVGDNYGPNWECKCKGKPYLKPAKDIDWKIPTVPDFDLEEWINNNPPIINEHPIENYV